MLQPSALNCSLSVVGGSKSAEGDVSQAKWDDEFLKLEGPEVKTLNHEPKTERMGRRVPQARGSTW